jgi:hypothetical protein
MIEGTASTSNLETLNLDWLPSGGQDPDGRVCTIRDWSRTGNVTAKLTLDLLRARDVGSRSADHIKETVLYNFDSASTATTSSASSPTCAG